MFTAAQCQVWFPHLGVPLSSVVGSSCHFLPASVFFGCLVLHVLASWPCCDGWVSYAPHCSRCWQRVTEAELSVVAFFCQFSPENTHLEKWDLLLKSLQWQQQQLQLQQLGNKLIVSVQKE